jgi:hypothetical protein
MRKYVRSFGLSRTSFCLKRVRSSVKICNKIFFSLKDEQILSIQQHNIISVNRECTVIVRIFMLRLLVLSQSFFELVKRDLVHPSYLTISI